MQCKRWLLAFVSTSLLINCLAQSPYPKGYFRNPLSIPISLSGNFGELRPNHYHMGLDLRTNKRENLPVYAAADGYVSRIKIEPGGFGRAIYIDHPNGYTTLYAHLNNFTGRLESYLKEQQYLNESWKIDVVPPPGMLPVKKGDFIAYSGNTGGSQAPHLHFEIRRTDGDINVNPLLFGFPLADNVKPRLLRLALYDRTASVYDKSPLIFALKVTAGGYVTAPALIQCRVPFVSLGITGTDAHSGSTNPNGIYRASLTVDGDLREEFTMDNISYLETRYLNAHIDYRYKTLGGPYIQHLSRLPGHSPSIYDESLPGGVIDLSDGAVHDAVITVSDTYGNQVALKTALQYVPAASPVPSAAPAANMFYPMMIDGFESDSCEFFVSEKTLYDSVRIRYASGVSPNAASISSLHAIGYAHIPAHDSFLIRLKPNRLLNEEEKSRTVMQWYGGSRKSVLKVDWQKQWASARFRDFGFFHLLLDMEPPLIVPIGFANGTNLSKSSRIVFTVRDNLEKIKNVKAYIDGRWIRFTNDKGRNFNYVFDENCPPGQHQLMIHAEDEAGNVTENSYNFTR
jgi:murein DD-endopeptidase MepM/ murein hydrolase activator NlpD